MPSARPRPRKPTPSRPPTQAKAPAPLPSALVGGKVTEVLASGRVRATLDDGAAIEARCPVHVDQSWLRAAVAVRPVTALFVTPPSWNQAVLWGCFADAEHESVVADVTIRGREVVVAAESITLACKDSHVRLDQDGSVEVRGKDLLSRASRINWIKGAAVRVN